MAVKILIGSFVSVIVVSLLLFYFKMQKNAVTYKIGADVIEYYERYKKLPISLEVLSEGDMSNPSTYSKTSMKVQQISVDEFCRGEDLLIFDEDKEGQRHLNCFIRKAIIPMYEKNTNPRASQ